MKILSINTFPDTLVGGGTERTRETLMRALSVHGHEVVGLGTAEEAGLVHAVENGLSTWRAGIRNLYWPRPDRTQKPWRRRIWHILDMYNGAMRRQVEHVLEQEKPDIVIIHNLAGFSISVVDAIRSQKIPVVQVLHDHYNICPNAQMYKKGKNCKSQCVICKIMRFPHRLITNQVNAVVGVSKYILDRHLACGSYVNVPIKQVIRNVRNRHDLGLEESHALRSDRLIRFGFIGALAPYKGIELLLESFVDLNNDTAELLVAGSGPPDYVAKLKRKFDRPGIRFLGHSSPKYFFPEIDVTIVPSLWQENLPGVISESLAFGVPVIGSHRGGIPEMIDENQNGFLFEPNRRDELIRLMRYFIDNRSEVTRMGKNALEASETFLDVERWYLWYAEIIEDLLKANDQNSI